MLEIAFENDINFDKLQPELLHDSSALETYYKLIVRCYKRYPNESNENLKKYVLYPLDSLNASLLNYCLISRVKHLINILLEYYSGTSAKNIEIYK